jgi:hypothetical protein
MTAPRIRKPDEPPRQRVPSVRGYERGDPARHVPEHVLKERDERLAREAELVERASNFRLLGDPIPGSGRSALERSFKP